jgi:hypothetical protein
MVAKVISPGIIIHEAVLNGVHERSRRKVTTLRRKPLIPGGVVIVPSHTDRGAISGPSGKPTRKELNPNGIRGTGSNANEVIVLTDLSQKGAVGNDNALLIKEVDGMSAMGDVTSLNDAKSVLMARGNSAVRSDTKTSLGSKNSLTGRGNRKKVRVKNTESRIVRVGHVSS